MRKVIFLLILLLIIPNSIADGMVHIKEVSNQWNLLEENEQLCAINYKDGYQNMVLAITTEELRGEKQYGFFQFLLLLMI